MEAISDAYVVVFSGLIIASMAVSVFVHVGALSAHSCASTACRTASSWGPWLAVLSATAATAAIARLFGPVFVSPAAASWLLPSPVDRTALLRPRLALAVVAGLGWGALVSAVVATVAGFGMGAVIVAAAIGGLVAIATVGAAVLGQGRNRWPLGVVTGALLALALLLVATGVLGPSRAAGTVGAAQTTALAAAGVLAIGLTAASVHRLPQLRAVDVAATGALAPAVSGALATLDFALVLDVVVAQRWRRRGRVRPLRGGPIGAGALVWRDVARLRRAPVPLLTLLVASIASDAAATMGAGRALPLVSIVVGFMATVPLLVGLRVLARTPALLRAMPFPDARGLAAAVVVPGAAAIVYGLVCVPALRSAVDHGPKLSNAIAMGIAVGLATLAAAARWVTGRPPDYARPLVSSPAGAVPTNLYGSAFRGFDIALITSLPLLLSPSSQGAIYTAVIALFVLTILLGRGADRR